jgi:poly-gamma-glutamate capsule biosynthesis protein CapA/YwtB (metallophosphatase superfamily)
VPRSRRSAPALLILLAAWSLAGCGPAPASPAATDTGTVAPTPAAPPSYTATAAPSTTPSATPSPTLTATVPPTSTPCPTPTITLSPQPPPLLAAVEGEPLPISLGWRFDANGHLTDAATSRRPGGVTWLLTSLGRTTYALTEDGEVAWRARMVGSTYALALLDAGQVAVGDDAGAVTLLDASGQHLWQHNLGSRVTALLGGWHGGLLAGGWDERLTFLSAGGEVQWAANLDGPVSGIAGLPELAVVATLEGDMRAFDAAGGEAWRFDAGAPVTNLEAIGQEAGGTVLVGLGDGRLLALDASATVRWQHALGVGGPVWHGGDVVGDTGPEIVVGMGGATPLLALLTAGGEMLWRIAVPSPVGAVTNLDLDGDGAVEILAGLASGQVLAYDGQGRLRGSVHTGLPVWGLQAGADGGSALALADVVAWRIDGVAGPSGGAWLPPPAMVPAPPDAERVDSEAILVFLGDVSPGRSMEAQLARFGAAHPWSGLEPLLQKADLAVANLEGVLTVQGQPLDKPYLIRAHPRWGQTLVEAGLDLVTLANNHALDFGPAGLEETLDTLEDVGIAAVGAGPSREAAHQPALFDLDGVRVAVLGYAAARWNGSVDVPATDRIAWAEPEAVGAEVRAVRDRADVVVVLLHAGTEYAAEPSPDQVAVAHAAVEAGADLVVGHHPHVTQTVERYRLGLIVYSLGDALFDIPRLAAMQGHLLRARVTQEGLVRAELWPFWIEDAIRPRLLDDGQGAAQVHIVYP